MPDARMLGRFSLALLWLPLWAGATEESAATAFETASVRFEQNATDGDVEVVFAITGGDLGLASLRIEAPDGRVVVDFRAPDASTLGVREFHFESPEPSDAALLKAAYPEGTYRFSGVTSAAQELRSTATLAHDLPGVVTLLAPTAGGDIPVVGGWIDWAPVGGVSGYIVEIEHDELNVNLSVELTADTTRLGVPAGFLVAGKEYGLGIASVLANGNVSFVETHFSSTE